MSQRDQKSDQQPDETPRGTPPGPEGEGPRNSPQTQPPRVGRSFFVWIVVIASVLLVISLIGGGPKGKKLDTWQDFRAVVEPDEGMIKDNTVVIRSSSMHATVKPGRPGFDESSPNGTPVWVEIDGSAEARQARRAELEALGIKITDNTRQPIWKDLLIPLLPVLILILLFWMLLARSMRSAGGGPGGMLGNFGKSKHRMQTKDAVNVTFAQIAGIDEAKEEVTEIVEFLKNPQKFQRLGGRIPRGVLLVGPPGCGKTLLAKAISGEADCPFFSISGSDFVEMFVGVGASRVRDLFKQAKENSPCIIFLDEIDAVGRRRGNGFSSGGHDEREQTLNAILVEMDGFEATDQVIVIAATNRSDVLDPALTRPGRFDRQVDVSLPDIVGRKQILEVHSKKVKLGKSVDLERIARGTPMFSGAELAALVNEAAILATMTDKEAIEHEDMEEARDKIRYGRARKSRRIEEQERVATAYHEAGHAVVQWLLEDADPVHKVTIIPRGQAMGATFSLPEKDRYGYGKRYLTATMRVLCGGRIAEQRKTGDVSSGASMDIRMGTQYARHMILEWGMSDRLGFVNYAGEDSPGGFVPEKDYSDETARVIDEEIRALIDAAYADCESMLEKHWDQVVAMAEALLKYETLTREDIDRIMRGERLDKPTVAELLQRETQATVAPSLTPPPLAPPESDEAAGGMMPSPA